MLNLKYLQFFFFLIFWAFSFFILEFLLIFFFSWSILISRWRLISITFWLRFLISFILFMIRFLIIKCLLDWLWLHKNTRFWLLITRLILHFKLNSRQSNRNTKMSDFFICWISISSLVYLAFFRFFLLKLWSNNRISDEGIFLMKKRNFSFYDLTCLESFVNNCLISIDCYIPVILNLVQTIVDYSTNTCFWSYLYKTNFFLWILLCYQFCNILLSFTKLVLLNIFLEFTRFCLLWNRWIFTWRRIELNFILRSNIFFLRSFLTVLCFPNRCALLLRFTHNRTF